ncbi:MULTISPECIES: type II toxin-antitoxin system PemK/MazF family toxin [Lactiplantibacillus]|uniref:Type II toxin-antitoxin system PemK/MazF family toxin n=1 Tax=Lactiplantibacillus plantarum subsp. plantarum TaxID=337330 RepID=A0A2S3U6X1_LACPN|nr:type II toxin-antitoxin system PemK/MazF family toxin [Lactiplantibacillus plantarum]AGL63097.2 Transcriptional regulator [Lactiplantibacillus plantarum subsp. plantarum P-8]AGO07098.1 cell growth regulatory protein [Lactiplantibacillus plantarum 16]ANJ14256.1 cell division protein [Lactiplantibacillus plantarum]APB86119.1 cell division protein [Lactiplantibacillus plantarum]AQY70660.1 cell division protein [Lactiplantibacillus plantarum]
MNGTNQYIPRKGDIVLINFNPSAGREIQKYRPALVVSNQKYARLTKLALVCPITHTANNRMTALGLLIKIKTPKVDGYINPLQFHTFDYVRRDMRQVGAVDKQILDQTLQVINDVVNANEV